MNLFRSARTLGCTVLCVAAAHSFAAITSYSATYAGVYQQFDDNSIPFVYGFGFSAAIAADGLGQIDAGTVTNPIPMTFDMTNSYNEGQYLLFGTSYYGTASDLLTDFPDGTYSYAVTAGTASPDMGDILVAPADWPSDIPQLINGSWSALQLAPANTDTFIEWNTYTTTGGFSNQETSLYLFDYSVPGYNYINYGPATTYTSDTIPAASMKGGHRYAYTIYFQNYDTLLNQGFSGAASSQQYYYATTGYYQVKADPGTVSGTLTLADQAQTLGEPIEIEIHGEGGLEETQTIYLGYFGYYVFDTTVTGVKTIKFKGRRHLRKAIPDVDLGVGHDYLDLTLISGDIDGDNAVTLLDFDIWSEYFDKSFLDADWFTVGSNGFAPVDADIDGGGSVDLLDYDYWSANYDTYGD